MASKRTNPLSGSFRDPPDKNKEQKSDCVLRPL